MFSVVRPDCGYPAAMVDQFSPDTPHRPVAQVRIGPGGHDCVMPVKGNTPNAASPEGLGS